ncbi:MAG: carbohydrate ABC transporter permease, partial [Actinobacteria bacterium]|nr:carbohydrate ABC transporter permease [Actinomycetota bacterium]
MLERRLRNKMAETTFKAKRKPGPIRLASLGGWAISILFFLPVAWIMSTAFKPKDSIVVSPPVFIFKPTFENMTEALSFDNTLDYFTHSIVYSFGSVAIAILVSYLAAYSFSRFKPAGTDFLMFLLLSTRFVPAAAFVIPYFQLFNLLKLKDSYIGLIAFYTMFSIPFSVWILKGFLDGISQRFDETGLVYGASRWHIMFKVILPQVKPGLVASFVFNILFVWNEFLFNFQLGGAKTFGIPVGLFTGSTKGGAIDWAYVASIGTLYVLPLV